MAKLITPSMVEQFKKIYSDASSWYNLSDAEIEQSLNLAYWTGNWYYWDSTWSNNSSSQTDTKNSDIVNNINNKVTNEDTINWTTTEEQEPTQETPKEWTTINLDKWDEWDEWDKWDDIKITELNDKWEAKTENVINPEAAEAYNQYMKILSNNISKDKLKEIRNAASIKSLEGDAENILIDLYWEDAPSDIIWNLSAIEQAIKSGKYKTEEDVVSAIEKLWSTRYPQIGLLISALVQWVWVKWIWKIFSAIWKAASKNLWLTAYTLMAAAENIWEWLSWKVNTTNTSFWWWLWNSAMNMLDNLCMNIISDSIEKNWKRPFWYNTAEDEAKYKATKIFKNSNTYKWTTELEKLWKDEEELATRLMVSALAVMNKYNLFNTSINQEDFYSIFSYDPITHSRYDNKNWQSIFDIIQTMSDEAALATQKNTNG